MGPEGRRSHGRVPGIGLGRRPAIADAELFVGLHPGHSWPAPRRLLVGLKRFAARIGVVRGKPRGGPTAAHRAGRRRAPLAEACNHGGQTEGRGRRRGGQSFPRHAQPRVPNEQQLRDPLTGFSRRWRTGTVAPCLGLFACAGGFPCAGVLPCSEGFFGSARSAGRAGSPGAGGHLPGPVPGSRRIATGGPRRLGGRGRPRNGRVPKSFPGLGVLRGPGGTFPGRVRRQVSSERVGSASQGGVPKAHPWGHRRRGAVGRWRPPAVSLPGPATSLRQLAPGSWLGAHQTRPWPWYNSPRPENTGRQDQ